MELKKSKDIMVDKILSQIGKHLGQEAENNASRPKISIVCNDIDEVTTKEKVRKTLEKGFNLIGLIGVDGKDPMES